MGWWQMSKGGRSPCQRFVCGLSSRSTLVPPLNTNSSSHLALSRSGDGKHWRDLRGAGVRPAGGNLHGSAGVCLDVKADTGKRGETEPPHLHLLCLPVPPLAPASPSPPPGCKASQLPTLTASAAGDASSSSPGDTIRTKPKIYLTYTSLKVHAYRVHFQFLAVEAVYQ